MAVEDALGVARRAGRVAEHRRGVLVERGEVEGVLLGTKERLVVEDALRRQRRAVVRDDDDVLDRRHLLDELPQQRQERSIDEDDFVLGVARDERELVRMKAEIQRVHDRAHRRRRRVHLEVPVVVPAERRDAVAGFDAEPRERVRDLARARVKRAVRVAVHRAVGEARDDLALWEERARAIEKMRQRQREVHHASGERHGAHRNAFAFDGGAPCSWRAERSRCSVGRPKAISRRCRRPSPRRCQPRPPYRSRYGLSIPPPARRSPCDGARPPRAPVSRSRCRPAPDC